MCYAFFFLIGHLDFDGMWCSEDQRANIIKTCLKEIGLYLQILKITLHSIVDIVGRTYVSSLEIDKTHNSDTHN